MKKGIPIRLDSEKHKKLLMYCVKNETSVQRILEEYVDMLLASDDAGVDFPDHVRNLFRQMRGSAQDGEKGNWSE